MPLLSPHPTLPPPPPHGCNALGARPQARGQFKKGLWWTERTCEQTESKQASDRGRAAAGYSYTGSAEEMLAHPALAYAKMIFPNLEAELRSLPYVWLH